MYYPVTNTQMQNCIVKNTIQTWVLKCKMVDEWTLGIQSAPDSLLIYSFNLSEKDFGRAKYAYILHSLPFSDKGQKSLFVTFATSSLVHLRQ